MSTHTTITANKSIKVSSFGVLSHHQLFTSNCSTHLYLLIRSSKKPTGYDFRFHGTQTFKSPKLSSQWNDIIFSKYYRTVSTVYHFHHHLSYLHRCCVSRLSGQYSNRGRTCIYLLSYTDRLCRMHIAQTWGPLLSRKYNNRK